MRSGNGCSGQKLTYNTTLVQSTTHLSSHPEPLGTPLYFPYLAVQARGSILLLFGGVGRPFALRTWPLVREQ
jgi:hypothetical protein